MLLHSVVDAKSGSIAEIRFNRPHRLNAVIEELYDEVLVALADAEAAHLLDADCIRSSTGDRSR